MELYWTPKAINNTYLLGDLSRSSIWLAEAFWLRLLPQPSDVDADNRVTRPKSKNPRRRWTDSSSAMIFSFDHAPKSELHIWLCEKKVDKSFSIMQHITWAELLYCIAFHCVGAPNKAFNFQPRYSKQQHHHHQLNVNCISLNTYDLLIK